MLPSIEQRLAGELAVIYDRNDAFLAIGLFDPDSPLRVRVLHAGKPVTIDAAWWRANLARALRRRDGLGDERTVRHARARGPRAHRRRSRARMHDRSRERHERVARRQVMNARTVNAPATIDADVGIVGAGPGGMAAALRIAIAVLLLSFMIGGWVRFRDDIKKSLANAAAESRGQKSRTGANS